MEFSKGSVIIVLRIYHNTNAFQLVFLGTLLEAHKIWTPFLVLIPT